MRISSWARLHSAYWSHLQPSSGPSFFVGCCSLFQCHLYVQKTQLRVQICSGQGVTGIETPIAREFMTRRKRVGDKTEPCITPLFTLKYSDVSPLVRTQLWVPSYHAGPRQSLCFTIDSCIKESAKEYCTLLSQRPFGGCTRLVSQVCALSQAWFLRWQRLHLHDICMICRW